MIRWVQIDTATAPGGVELRLMRRGFEFSIMVGPIELMNSRRGGSEAALAEIACAQLTSVPAPRVLIGGLGMGFTLRAALSALGPQARVIVCELVPQVIDWARGPLAEIFGASLDDPRVEVTQADVLELIVSARSCYDAILLDVDNGPDGLVGSTNDGLYNAGGLAAARKALTPAGVLAIWSASNDAAFRRRMAGAGFRVDEHVAGSGRSGRGARHRIWIAKPRSDRSG